MIRFALSATLLLAPSASWGCSEPYASISLPSAPGSYSKPDVPYCLSNYSFSGTHTCDDWEIDRYKQEVEDYVEKLQEYMNDAAEVASEAAQFAEEAADYARCEAEEVSNQHK